MYLEVCAGFANRLRATVSGICAAEDVNCSLTLSWPVESVFAATFTDLFEPIDGIITCSLRNPNTHMCLSPEDWLKEKTNSNILIKSYGQFHQSDPARWNRVLRSLQLRPTLVEFAEKTIRLTYPIVGVHIRRTDTIVSRQKSPTHAFLKKMLTYDTNIFFFIATDDINEWDIITKSIPVERLVRANINHSRDTLSGIMGAVIDFLCLSKCSEILGSAGSSFSEMAAAYGECPLHIINQDN